MDDKDTFKYVVETVKELSNKAGKYESDAEHLQARVTELEMKVAELEKDGKEKDCRIADLEKQLAELKDLMRPKVQQTFESGSNPSVTNQ